ncbi:hypothetical protein ROZALSC1DRAFT_28990 [Rozella allomycis CSF55]|uniref:Uncharacterized protein n=1 Tax=Rozella allomycis (strain CSF55) TaxID=988480 RepID=A0A4P9YLL0_ROZAC|nr:hypothetical protein ROZALSC1DRAFT_28990 [Rozella allomycis CSF55]
MIYESEETLASEFKFEPSGILTSDYIEYCKKRNFKPMKIAICKPKTKLSNEQITEAEKKNTSTGTLLSKAQSTLLEQRDTSLEPLPLVETTLAVDKTERYSSIGMRTPTIWVEMSEEQEMEDSVYKIAIRGWTPNKGTLEALCTCFPSCMTLNVLK